VKPLKPQLAFDPSMAHEIVEGESQRDYLARLLAPIPTDGSWVMEPKLDGVRWQVLIDDAWDQVGPDVIKLAKVTSVGGRNLKQHATPRHIGEALKELPAGTILDGELVAGDMSSDVGRVDQRGKQKYVVFDVLAFNGLDVTRHPWSARRELLEQMLLRCGAMDSGCVDVTPVTDVDLDVLCQWVGYGAEGAVCKRKDASYRPGSRSRSAFVKIKPKQTTDAIVEGFEMGEGKSNRHRVGALKVRLLETMVETTVGYDCTVEKARAMFGRRIEVQHFGFCSSGKVRHPGYVRMRPDLEPAA
jgi:ATP-dependent DNA ligase